MPFLRPEQLTAIGFRWIGDDVRVSDGARFYGPERIDLGDHCRIDDFALLSAGAGGISVGRYVHIACFCSVQGDAPIVLDDYAGLSSRTAVYSSTDDFSGVGMTGPMVPEDLRQVTSAPVHLGKHALVGAGSVILPGVTVGIGAAAGALSLIRDDVPPFTIVAGIPARVRGLRRRDLLDLERRLEQRA